MTQDMPRAAKGSFPYPPGLRLIAGPEYWDTRARLLREMWKRADEVVFERRGRKPISIPNGAIAAYLAGDSVAVVAEEHGINCETLRRHLRQRGIARGQKQVPLSVVEEYQAGATITSLVAKYGLYPALISQAIKAAGVSVARGPRYELEREQDFARRYLAGETLKQIGDSYGISRERVRQVLKRAGVKSLGFRPKNRQKPRPLTDAEQDAVRLYSEGVRKKEIVARTGVGYNRITTMITKLGIKKGHGFWLTRPDDEELTATIAKLYLSGMGSAEIARRVPQINKSETVYYYLKKAGVPARGRRK